VAEEKQPESQPKPKPEGGDGGQRFAIGAALVFIVVAGAVYFLYFRRQSAFYTARDLRVLRTVTAALDERIGVYSGYVENNVRYHDQSVIRVTDNCGRKVSETDNAALPETLNAMPGQELFERTLVYSGNDAFLRFAYYALMDVPKDAKPKVDNLRRGCSDVTLSEILQPAFNLDLAQAFDEIVVADSGGHVLYHVHPPRSRSSLLFENAPGKSDSGSALLEIQELDALLETKGWLRETKALDPRPLLRASRTTPVILSDASYMLFSQPYTPGTIGANQKWIVCGLVSAPRFRLEAARIPAPLALLGTALAILAICAWPFLRIALTNELEPITLSDAVLVAICTIIAAAILTLAFLDTFSYRHLTSIARKQLEQYADKLAGHYDGNVARAAAALDSIRWKTKDADWKSAAAVRARLSEPDPRDPLCVADPLESYPYFRSFAWVDATGVERFKYSAADTPRVDVSGRQYFIAAMRDDLWLTSPVTDPAGVPRQIPFAIEWVRSAATGDVTAVIAERTNSPDFPVITLTTDLIDLTSSVPPPDVRFAVIDEQGNVLYHSDPQRIGYENFFTEADQNPSLRSAVLGRRAGVVEADYWGDNTEMYVRPLPSSAWTLVVFRAKKLVRVLNEETLLLTLMPLLLGSMPYVLIYGAILLAAPRYRAPALWPDPARRGDYIRLARLYAILGVTYALAIYLFDAKSLPPIVFLFPAQAIVSTYILLHRDDRRPRVGLALAGWIVLTLLLGWWIRAAVPDTQVFAAKLFHAAPRTPVAIVLVLLAVAALASLSFFMPASEGGAKRSLFRMSYSRAYRLCGALLLVLAAALPVVGYFKIATHISIELYAKYAQLRMATKLESRLNALAALNSLGSWSGKDVRKDVLDYETLHVFESRWCLSPPPLNGGPTCLRCSKATRATIPPLFPDVLPALSEDFLATRMLQEEKSLDSLWSWCSAKKDGALVLDRVIRLQPSSAKALYTSRTGVEIPHEQQALAITSVVPLLREMHPASVSHIAALVGLSLVAFAVFWIAADFIARRLLLIDLAGPLWLRRVPLSPSLGDHIFLVRRDKSANQLTGAKVFYDVSFAAMDEEDSWNRVLAGIDASVAGRNIRVIDFEYGIDDGAKNAKKLEWLERLLALPDRTVIIVSKVSPGYIYTAPAAPPAAAPAAPPDPAAAAAPPAPPPEPDERWKKVLSRFVVVTQEQLDLPEVKDAQVSAPQVTPKAAASPRESMSWRDRLRNTGPWLRAVWAWLTKRLSLRRDRRDWIRLEAQHDRYLARLADEMEPLRKEIPPGEEQQLFLDEIGERAGGYYAGLWASCSLDEKILLFQLARHGLLNGKDRRLVRRLMARRFVRRAPQLEIFSETFRRYILAAARREDLKHVAATRRPSRWKDLRGALAVLVIAFVLMLFATQQDLFKTANGLVTGLAAAVPLITKLLGLLGDRRADAALRG
jgi:hypothetical protein